MSTDSQVSQDTHPGRVLAARLAAMSMSASELARHLGIPVNRVTQIINGQRGITGDTALRLARFFGGAPVMWLDLQKAYELHRAEEEKGDEIRRTVPTFHDITRTRKPPQTALLFTEEVA